MKRILPSRDTLRIPDRALFLPLTALFVLCTFTTFSQQASKQISGKVTDGQSLLPLAGVSIVEKGSGVGHRADSNGVYKINVAGNTAVLIFSHVGYKSQEVFINDHTNIDIALVSDAKNLAEVTVINVGYGTLRKNEVSSAVTHLDAKDLLTGSNNSVLMAINGKVAGLTVDNTAASDPNSTPTLQMRGVSSRNAGLTPLVVVDGIAGANIDNINQNDILSIDVLKDASAAAIYGSWLVQRGERGT